MEEKIKEILKIAKQMEEKGIFRPPSSLYTLYLDLKWRLKDGGNLEQLVRNYAIPLKRGLMKIARENDIRLNQHSEEKNWKAQLKRTGRGDSEYDTFESRAGNFEKTMKNLGASKAFESAFKRLKELAFSGYQSDDDGKIKQAIRALHSLDQKMRDQFWSAGKRNNKEDGMEKQAWKKELERRGVKLDLYQGGNEVMDKKTFLETCKYNRVSSVIKTKNSYFIFFEKGVGVIGSKRVPATKEAYEIAKNYEGGKICNEADTELGRGRGDGKDWNPKYTVEYYKKNSGLWKDVQTETLGQAMELVREEKGSGSDIAYVEVYKNEKGKTDKLVKKVRTNESDPELAGLYSEKELQDQCFEKRKNAWKEKKKDAPASETAARKAFSKLGRFFQ